MDRCSRPDDLPSSTRTPDRADALEALRTGQEALAAARRLEVAVGMSPQRALGVEGSGLLGAVDRMDARLAGVEGQLAGIRAELHALGAAMLTHGSSPPGPRRRRTALGAGLAAGLVAIGTAISALVAAARAPIVSAPPPPSPPAAAEPPPGAP